MRYKTIVISLLLLICISCSAEYGKLSTAISSAHQGIQNIQAAYEAALFIKENIIEGKETIKSNEKERLLENYEKALQLSYANFTEALEIYQEVIRKKPGDAFILNSLGHTYMWLNQKHMADKYFEQALKFCKSSSLKESIEFNKSYFPEVKKYYTLFNEIDSLIKKQISYP